jgi:hypothetical protein
MGMQAQTYGGNMPPNMNQNFNALQPGQPRASVMNGFNGVPQALNTMSTPSSMGGGYPMWDMDIPSQMFMQTMNFERMMQQQQQQQQQGMMEPVANMSVLSNRSDDASNRNGG